MLSKGRVYGLMGFPVKHSLSPAMHNAAFKALGIDARYELFEVAPQELKAFLDSLKHRDIDGLNVTIPHKEGVLGFVKLEEDSLYARQIKAVNTIVKREGVWLGYNTDVPGFLKHLRENIDPRGKKAAVIGAGGAGKAVAYALASAKPKQLSIFDIDRQKVESLVNLLQGLFKDVDIKLVDSLEALNIRDKEILINATPIGMKESDPCLVSLEVLHKDLFVYDLVYSPRETKLLKLAKNNGAKTCNGLAMLLYQGMLSFEIWTGKKAPQEEMWKALNFQVS